MEIREILSFNLKRLRRAKKVSQEELAHRAEIDRTHISNIERCKNAVTIDILDRLARGLEVEADELLRRPQASAQEKKRVRATK